MNRLSWPTYISYPFGSSCMPSNSHTDMLTDALMIVWGRYQGCKTDAPRRVYGRRPLAYLQQLCYLQIDNWIFMKTGTFFYTRLFWLSETIIYHIPYQLSFLIVDDLRGSWSSRVIKKEWLGTPIPSHSVSTYLNHKHLPLQIRYHGGDKQSSISPFFMPSDALKGR